MERRAKMAIVKCRSIERHADILFHPFFLPFFSCYAYPFLYSFLSRLYAFVSALWTPRLDEIELQLQQQMLRIDLGGFRAPEKAEEEAVAHN